MQQTLDYNSVLPLYNALVAYGAQQGLALTGRGEAHITVGAAVSDMGPVNR